MAIKETKYRLGLDMGTNSIGWAAVLLDDSGEPCGLLDMGVRIFPDGRNDQSKQSNAVDRRQARGQRRRRDRYLARRGELMGALVECGLMPKDVAARKRLEEKDPYELRARALDEPLHAHELGRALFHLNQRRGFKSNRKAGGDEKEDGEFRAAISELRQRIQDSGARTLGEYLQRRRKRGEPVRGRPETGLRADRAMCEMEFDKIRAAQKQHQALESKQWDELRHIIFYQQDLRPVHPGRCQFEDGEHRAAKALPIFQEFRMLQEVNNLRFHVGIEPERPLDEYQRERAMNRLRSGTDIKLAKGKENAPINPTRDLGLPTGAVFNLAAGGRNAIKGDETAGRLMARKKTKTEPALTLFGKRWIEMTLDERNEIVRFLLDTEDPEVVKHRATAEWGMSEELADGVSNVSLPPGYGNLSEKAIRKILPHLEQGLRYSDAVVAAGYPHHSDFRNQEAHEELPYYGAVLPRDAVGADSKKDPERHGEAAHFGRIANPTVHIGLGQLRRVVNGLIAAYGKPEEIVVELARELKWNDERKQKHQHQQSAGRERNNYYRNELGEEVLENSPDALRKLRLWEEQGPPHARVCPYTGRPLSLEMVMSPETEVDHILPFSRTLDNSMANLVVCMADANRVKGNQTPYEAFGDQCLPHVANFTGKGRNKIWRFQKDAMKRYENEERDFLDRQLNEAQYLSRTARTYLAHLYDEQGEHRQRVRVIPGQMTALLRRGWGLEGMLSRSEDGESPRKTRYDHRHHAVDAFVVANTTQGLLKKFSDAAGSDAWNAAERLSALVPPPWEGFDRNEVQAFLENMVVSYKPDHGTRGKKGQTTGQLHNEMAYGIVNLVENGASEIVIRKPLPGQGLYPITSRKGLEDVRDEALRAALLELWDEVHADSAKLAEFTQKVGTVGVSPMGRSKKDGNEKVNYDFRTREDVTRATEDETVRAALWVEWDKIHRNAARASEFGDRAATKGVLLNGRLQRVRRVRVVTNDIVIPIKDRDCRPYKGYKPDSNEFADIWRMPDGTWRTVVVSTFDANQRGFNPDSLRPHPAARRLMRLQINDMGALGEGADRRIVRVRKITNAKTGVLVYLDDNNEADVDARVRRSEMKAGQHSSKQLRSLGFRKVRVDELGRVFDRGPFKA